MIRALRKFLAAAATAALCAFGAPASAYVYNVGFDPVVFAGIVTIDVAPGCFSPFPAVNACAFDVLSVNFTDSDGFLWFIGGPQPGIGEYVAVDAADALAGIQVTISGLMSNDEGAFPCDGDALSFDLKGGVSFRCGGRGVTDVGTVTTIVRVPEPATAALLGAGLVGIVVTRRRRRD